MKKRKHILLGVSRNEKLILDIANFDSMRKSIDYFSKIIFLSPKTDINVLKFFEINSIPNVDYIVMKDHNGKELEDVSTPDQVHAAADFLTVKLIEITKDENTILHCIIADMGEIMCMLLSIAFSLVGRRDDRLYNFSSKFHIESTMEKNYVTEIPVSLPDNAKIFPSKHSMNGKNYLTEIPIAKLGRRYDINLSPTNSYTELVKAIEYAQSIDEPPATIYVDEGLNIIGKNKEFRKTMSQIKNMAELGVKQILILGETGTGKESAARLFHKHSAPDKEFVPINCAKFIDNEQLFASELFGHVKGAYSGANQTRTGIIEKAKGGTIFLDELAKMPVSIQAKLLRFLDSGEFQPVGSDVSKKGDVKLVFATNINPDKLHESFAEDFFYRIKSPQVVISPLRERRDDIKLLAGYFCNIYSKQFHKRINSISQNLLEKLRRHDWSGNIRDLSKVIETAVLEANDEDTILTELPEEIENDLKKSMENSDLFSVLNIPIGEDSPDLRIEEVELRYLEYLIKKHKSVSAAAEAVGGKREYIRDRRKLLKKRLAK